MTLLSNLTLGLFYLAIMATRQDILARGAGQQGCCTSYSRVRVVNSILSRGGVGFCRRQGITEQCNIEAVVLKWKRRQICVNPNPHRTAKLLSRFCYRKDPKERRKQSHLHRKKSKI